MGYGYTIVDPETGAGGYIIEGRGNGGSLEGDFGQRYLAWVNSHMITNGYVVIAALVLIPFVTVTKALFGLPMVLGTTNPYTTVLRGIAVLRGWTAVSAIAAAVGPFIGAPALLFIIFIGFFNIGTLLAGLFYAKSSSDYRDINIHSSRYIAVA